jgi:maleylpyruvate isomerase
MLTLHGYWRSGTTYRIRIGLNLKRLSYRTAPVNLLEGEQRGETYSQLNPQGLVPALEADGRVLIQSPAILEWLEEVHPAPPLLPDNAGDRSVVRAMAALIGCDIHPLNNLRVLKALKGDFGADQTQLDAWARRWIEQGFAALERLVAEHGRGFCFGRLPGLADCYVIPQLYSARRFGVDLAPYPRRRAVDELAHTLKPFGDAHPDQQPDAVTIGAN